MQPAAMRQWSTGSKMPEVKHYIAVKGSLFATETYIFGINDSHFQEEALKLGVTDLTVSPCVNGVILNRDPMYVVNLVSRFGYEVIAASGGQECMWTMRRTIEV
ncbi:uncharacterized protein LOC119096414 isoform X2 [Pollicipes pollicipes]|uniref:uncharacterized protein LOC119096414 isoform X2 n=1 Tax=Pollicipes pollicipes TaxID=41117 RepID=UPI001884DCE9|nr:uncharacterized protein LOC119096414 isoform X2 [Pollicipes pollicipes]